MMRLRPGSRRSFAARAKARRGWAEIKMGLEAVALAAKSPAAKSPAMTAAAGEWSAVSRCWAASTKTRLWLGAERRLGGLVRGMELAPGRRAPSFSGEMRRVGFL